MIRKMIRSVFVFSFSLFIALVRLIGYLFVVASINLFLSFIIADIYISKIKEFCARDTPSFKNALFFAWQTITTTGYGSEINLDYQAVQELSTWFMPISALVWAISISVIWLAINKRP